MPNSDYPGADESQEMMQVILDHYMKHHEIVLKKLHFAQDATQKGIDEIRNVKKKMEEKDNTNLATFTGFDEMWKEIIQMFVEGGVSQDELFKIEEVITTIPKDIKTHYDQLCQQDKSFLALVESLNTEAYKKARDVIYGVQDGPNPLSGLTQEEYEAKSAKGDDYGDAVALQFNPIKKKKQ